MSESEFRINRRQKFLTERYSSLNAADIARSIRNKLAVLGGAAGEAGVDPADHGSLFKNHLKLLRLHYTAGEPIESLRPLYTEAMTWFEAWHRAYRDYIAALGRERGESLRDDGSPCQFEDLFHFQLALDAVSLGVLLGEAEQVRRAAQWLARYRHTDMLFEAIVEPVFGEPSTVEEFFHEKPYDPLLDAIYAAESPEQASALVKQYLDGWYKAFEGVPWHDGHLVQTEEYSNYEGYWAFEAAAVCVIHGIDDTSFRDHLIYPKDLADWARANDAVARLRPGGGHAASAASGILRCESKHPCPREGYWFTPAQPGSRRHFKQGELMPSLGTDYGQTIWQWDDNQQP